MMEGAEIDVRYGRARVVIESDISGEFSAPVVSELKKAIVSACLGMDTDGARKLATRVEGTP